MDINYWSETQRVANFYESNPVSSNLSNSSSSSSLRIDEISGSEDEEMGSLRDETGRLQI